MTTQSVTERKAGDMTEAEGRESPPADDKTPVEGDKVSSKTPKTYTEKELREAVKAAEGRAAKDVSTYKSQAETTIKSLQSLQAERDKLQELIDEDPDKASLAKKMRELDEKIQKYTDMELTLAEKESGFTAREQKVKISELKDLVFDVGSRFDDGTTGEHKSVELQKYADIQTKKGLEVTEPDLLEYAELRGWTKQANPEEAEEEAIVPPVSMGGGKGKRIYTAKEIEDRSFWEANKVDIELAQREGRIKK